MPQPRPLVELCVHTTITFISEVPPGTVAVVYLFHNTLHQSLPQGHSKMTSICRVSQEERPIFWEVIVSVILSKTLYMNMRPIPNGFRDRAIWMYNRKIVAKKETYYEYILFLIPVFIVQVTELVQFIINVRKFHRQHQCTLQLVLRTWRVVRLGASWRSFMHVITSSMLTSSSSRAYTFFSVHLTLHPTP